MKRDLKYYNTLPYKIEIKPIPKELGGGYNASMPELGKYALHADGDTIEEALSNLEAYKDDYFKRLIENKATIPEPISEEEFSGKFVLRIEPWLHKLLKEKSQKESTSLNNCIRNLIINSLTSESKENDREERAVKTLQELTARMSSLEDAFSYSYASRSVFLSSPPSKTMFFFHDKSFSVPGTTMKYIVEDNEIVLFTNPIKDSE